MSERLKIDRAVCHGHGLCYSVAPEIVEPDEQGDPVVLADSIPEQFIELAREAVNVCPERAIILEF
ncbi:MULTISPECIES: ferredoxin [unclassified Mycolicibacterium]|uniref:ferredoxin n=1 Tax=unclassified Mycolicibacterium TaxID=2636767 RepID=UPI00281655EA|nr:MULTISPECIES: ferredoxin [unclassified Mycolicibacterium]